MLYEFRGYDGQIELYENKIIIRRAGAARLTRGFSLGDKEIYLKSISGIQVKKPGLQAGYIQFIFSGSKEAKGTGIMKIATDENTVMFQGGTQKYQEALELKKKIEKLLYQPTETQTVSKADELIKYKQLLDAGAITEEEFLSEKNRLLASHRTTEAKSSHFQQEIIYRNHMPSETAETTIVNPNHSKPRIGMTVLAAVCAALAVIYALISIAEPFMLSMAGLFGVLALMFFVLSKSPKRTPFILGKKAGLKKSLFALICVVVAFVIIDVSAGTTGDTTPQENGQGTSQSSVDTQVENSTSTSPDDEEQESEQPQEINPEDYEGDVFTAFWENASESFGVEYSDYKWAHTAYSYISDSQTSDGYIAYYYLIQTAYESTNAFGQNVLHEITARCYYVPEYSNTIYTTYITLDGKTVYFDEETEDWLLDMG